MDNFNRKTHVKTSRGWLSRTDKNDWFCIYNEYLDSKSITELADELGIGNKVVKDIFLNFNFKLLTREETKKRTKTKRENSCFKKYGIEYKMHLAESRAKFKQTCLLRKIKTTRGYLSKTDKNDWINIYQEYLDGKSIVQLKEELHIRYETIRDMFMYFNFKFLSKEETNKRKVKKIKQTCLKIYGFESPNKSKKVMDKKEKTCLKKYGSKSASCSKYVKSKKNNNIKIKIEEFLKENNYELIDIFNGVHNRDDNNNHISWKKYNIKHLDCGTIYETYFNGKRFIKCPKCYPYQSNKEIHFRNYISNELGINVIHNRRNITGKEIDIYIKDSKVAFEYNGFYWHSFIHPHINKNYHGERTKLCLEKDIKLYHIWEHDNEEIVKSLIRSKLNMVSIKHFARKMVIKEVDYKTKKEFFDLNHLHGDVNSSFSLGLYNKDKLISCISFRKHKEGLEIARFATLLNMTVCGGFSKLLKHSIQYIKKSYPNINKIITYCDRDWTPSHEDSVYYKNGFSFIRDTGCQLKYYNYKIKNTESREKYQKHKLKDLFPDIYGDNLTADQILYKKHILPIYNSGNWKYELNI
jgi:hypothetical protein